MWTSSGRPVAQCHFGNARVAHCNPAVTTRIVAGYPHFGSRHLAH